MLCICKIKKIKKLRIIQISILLILILFVGHEITLNAGIRPITEFNYIKPFSSISKDQSLSEILEEDLKALETETNIANLPDLKLFEYTVKKGDTIDKIVRKFGIDRSTIFGINPTLKEGSLIYPGNRLLISNMKGLLCKVKPSQSVDSIARKYKENKVKTKNIVAANDLLPNEKISVGEWLFIPGARLPENEILDRLEMEYLSPLKGSFRVTSLFTSRRTIWIKGRKITRPHWGVDVAQRYGAPIRAARSGEVIYAGWAGGYGKLVKIKHGKGLETRYGHMSKILVRKGTFIKKGQIIGKVGSTGMSTGPHLHLEVRKYGKPQNPLKFFKGIRRRAKWSSH